MEKYSYFFKVADIRFSVHSDVSLDVFSSVSYKKYQIDRGKVQFEIFFEELNSQQLTDQSAKLTPEEKKFLEKSIAWAKHWSKNRVLNYVQIVSILKLCLKNPEMNHIVLAFNRIIIRNFFHKKLYYIYPAERRKNFSDLDFHAMYRNLMAPFFLIYSSSILHGSSVKIGDKAAVFHAPDEGGKTTLVSNFKPNSILSDDQVCIRKERNKFYAFSTPFGKMGESLIKAEVAALFLLEKADRFQLRSIPRKDLVKFLWNEHKLIWLSLPINLRKEAFNLIVDYCSQVPVYKMQFSKNYVDWDAIAAVMK